MYARNDMMDSDDSSSEEHSSSESSTDSSDDDRLETVEYQGYQVQVPQGLCEKKPIFDEFFSVHTWNSLSDSSKQHLKKFLPKFDENDDQEKSVTLQKLFGGEAFKFTSPLDNFYEHLRAGHYRPDIAKMRHLIRRAERKESIWRHKKHKERLEAEIMESRRQLLAQVSSLPPDVGPRLPKPSTSLQHSNTLAHRTKRRYFQILSSVRSKVEESGFSSDENYPEGPPTAISRKQKRHLSSLKASSTFNGEKVIVATTAMKSSGFDLERHISPSCNPFFITEQSYRTLLLEHKRRKVECGDDLEFETKTNNLSDIISRTKLNYNKKLNKHPEIKVTKKKIKKEIPVTMSPELPAYSSDSDSDSILEVKPKIKKPIKAPSPKLVPIKQEIKLEEVKVEPPPPPPPPPLPPPPQPPPPQTPPTPISTPISTPITTPTKPNYQFGKITPATLSDLDGIDMMNIPIDLDDTNIDIIDINNKAELMQDTHANFLALVRDIICSTTEHRMDMATLEERLKVWQENPITALNDWYCLADNWTSQLQSAVNFLSGNFPEQPDDFVPYMEFKPSLNMYQWIGAGRDGDSLLAPLCQYWLEHRNEMKPVISIREKDDVDLEVVDRSQTPPPPRCSTTWTVRKASTEEVKSYREQERRRYDNPHKAFTYRCNGYESVVGPLKGIYNASVGNTKARGHTMLSADRPNFVTILSLVRDATARLPNGEGTRSEICELLKCSQYISSTAPDNVLQSVVSGALDRMHTQFDPCVKYDPKRKIWIYLHRNRTEEDFERLHQQYQGMNKNMKKPTKHKTPTKPKAKSEKVVKSATKSPQETTEKPKVVPPPPPVPTQPVAQSLITVNQEAKQTSLLIPQNVPNKLPEPIIDRTPKIVRATQEVPKESTENIVHNSIVKPKSNKSLVKIITSTQGKSLIIPSSSNSVAKLENKPTVTKITPTPVVTQQIIQSITQQKQINPQQLIRVEIPETSKESVKKTNVSSISHQMLCSISPQQLQNIKNVTLLRNVRQPAPQTMQKAIIVEDQKTTIQQNSVVVTQDNKLEIAEGTQQVRLHCSSPLTPSQQQQLLQSIAHRGIGRQQQLVLQQHKAPILQKSAQPVATTLLGQNKDKMETTTNKPVISSGQGPLVAKVLTNTGQVISVESLLAHQKQHGTLPQGTTLRVQGVKGGTNIIQLSTSPTKSASGVTQVAVGSQNNFITLANQPKLVLSSTPISSATTTVTAAKPITKPMVKSQPVTKFPSKVTQQIINAKFVDAPKLVQPKVIIGQNQIKLGNKNIQKTTTVANQNSIRMVNAANLNLAHLSGKPVLLASKNNQLQNIQGQNVIIQTQANTSNSGLVALSTSAKNSAVQTQSTNVSVINQGGQMVLAPQLKMQQQVLLSSGVKNSGVLQGQSVSSGQIIVGGHSVRLQTTTANAQRVVLASQAQGGQIVAQQILLPAGFQGTAINIKSLQGVKVIPIAAQQNKGLQGRQMFARVMNPSSLVRTTTAVPTPEVRNTPPTTE